jgi:hypothetical protein
MKAIRLAAVLSIVMTMGLVAMDTANASSIVYTRAVGGVTPYDLEDRSS